MGVYLVFIRVYLSLLCVRVETIRKRTTYLLTKCQERLHVVQGLLTAINQLDTILHTIQHTGNTTVTPKQCLLAPPFNFSEAQVH